MKLLLYLPQILLSIMAVFIIVRLFVSLFSMRPAGRPKAVLINRNNGKKLAISTYETSIGRARSSDIQLASSLASRSHAVISRRKQGWFITDTESKTGTFVNGAQINEPTRIYHDDLISIGGVDYTFIAPHARRDDAQQASSSGAVATDGYIVNLATDYEYPINNGRITIGRGAENDVAIDDPTVSRRHAEVIYTDEGWCVVDRDSRAGVGVNGYRVHGSQPIDDGDTIMINTHSFAFKEANSKKKRRGARG